MEFLHDPDYIYPTTIGLGGILLWVLKTWADPNDDTITGTLYRALVNHSRTFIVTVLSYLLLSVVAWEIGEWTTLASIASGYASQSLLNTVLEARTAKQAARLNGDGGNGGAQP